MKIEHKTRQWLEQGIISEGQAKAIHEFEESSGKKRWSHMGVYGFLILGSFVLATGLVSLIAANWEFIPSAVKLAAAFVWLVALGTGVFSAHDNGRGILYDFLSTIFVFSCLATLGLITQIYHSGGALYQGLALWLVIILPLSYLGKGGFLPAMWVTCLLITFFTWALDNHSWWAEHFLSDSYFHEDNVYPLFMITAMWTFFIGAIGTHFEGLERFTTNLWFWGLLAGFVATIAGDVYWSAHEKAYANALYPAYLLLPLSIAAIISRKDASHTEKAILTGFLGLSLAIYLPSLFLGSQYRYDYYDYEIFELMGASYFIISAALLALYFAAQHKRRLFHAMTVVIGIRFIIIYLQVFEDLAYTGTGLILTGLLIIGSAATWYKLRPRLEIWAKELVS